MESSTVTLNGKEFDINNREECQECLQEVKNIRENLDAGIFQAWLDAIYYELEKVLEKKIASFPDETEEEDFTWPAVDLKDSATRIADDYLTETFGDKYDELPDEDKYRNLKTVASVLRWYIDKYER